MAAYQGLPPARIDLYLDHSRSRSRYAHQAEFAIGRLELVGNIGTYLDSPYHRYRDGADISELPLEQLVDLPTVVVDARSDAARTRRLDLWLDGPIAGRAVLIRTGWDRRWGSESYWQPGHYLGDQTIKQLTAGAPALVGVDFWNVDDPDDPARPAHTALLGAGIPIVEHLHSVWSLTPASRVSVVPLAVAGAPSLPVRAFAIDH